MLLIKNLLVILKKLLELLFMLLYVLRNKHLLIRILISRDEIDMPVIKQYYKQLYGKDIIEDFKSEISGDYQKLMIELCSH